MKTLLQNLLWGSTILFSSICFAQPTLNQGNCAPTNGESFTQNICSYLSPGNTGANQTWDLSSLNSSSSVSVSISNASSSTYASTFPNATIMATTTSGSGSSSSFYKTSSSVWQTHGIVVPSSNVVISYSDYEDLLRFPFTYSDSYTDDFSASFTSAGYTYYRSGSTTVTADSYGTLILPSGTYTNVLRVHFVQDYQDSTYIGFPYVIDYLNDQYMYYMPDIHQPIASVYTITAAGSTSSSAFYLSNISGISEETILSSCSIFPNPALENVTINFNLTENKRAEIKLYNSLGIEVLSPVEIIASAGTNEYQLSIENLSGGIYFMQLYLDGEIASTRQLTVSK